jgi:SAM-dependent methyltransferase
MLRVSACTFGGVRTQGRIDDAATAAYFDRHVPEFGVERLERTADFIRRHAKPGASLIDLGCGAGNTLEYLRDSTPVEVVAGLDVSQSMLDKTRARLGCHTYYGSIFDRDFVSSLDRRYDFAVLAAVLHHLIGRTRNQSRGLAQRALRNSVELLEPGGHLIVLEPIFYPSIAMDALFYLKKGVSRLTSKRVGVGGYWNNIGAPVVSYYTNEELVEMVERTPGLEIVEREVKPDSLGPVLDRVLRKTSTTLAARRI